VSKTSGSITGNERVRFSHMPVLVRKTTLSKTRLKPESKACAAVEACACLHGQKSFRSDLAVSWKAGWRLRCGCSSFDCMWYSPVVDCRIRSSVCMLGTVPTLLFQISVPVYISLSVYVCCRRIFSVKTFSRRNISVHEKQLSFRKKNLKLQVTCFTDLDLFVERADKILFKSSTLVHL